MKEFSMRLNRPCSAPPDVVYDLLADLATHLTWGGAQQSSDFRLLSLDAPAGPATVGTTFTSTGTIPMSSRRFEDRSKVTVAERPYRFEFVTNATVHRAERSMEATYRHRYEMSSTSSGSMVTYELTQLSVANPFLRLSLPVVREMSWGVALPFLAGRGFRNLLALARKKARVGIPSPA